MKTISLALAILTCLFSAGCESRTEYGECIGINDEPRADLEYRFSTQNIVVGVIFFEMIFPPIIVLLNELRCPVAHKHLSPVMQ